MVFTLGLRSAYRVYREAALVQGVPFQKQGRTDDYQGGSVFPTKEAAVAWRDRHRPEFAVWSVDADWLADTAPNDDPAAPYRDLIRTSTLVKEVA